MLKQICGEESFLHIGNMIPIKSVGSELNNEASCILRNGKGFAVFSHRSHDAIGLV